MERSARLPGGDAIFECLGQLLVDELEREAFVDLFDTADQVEGVSAFLEKRAAQWKNA